MLAVDHIMSDVLTDHTPCVSQSSQNTSTTNKHHNKAFVIGRPPGHHAGPNGYVSYICLFRRDTVSCVMCHRCVISEHHWKRPDMTSSGFCLLNTVGVAAVSFVLSPRILTYVTECVSLLAIIGVCETPVRATGSEEHCCPS